MFFWAEQLGGRPKKLVVHGGGGSAQLAKAAAAVSAGVADVVVVFFGKSAFATGPSSYPAPGEGPLRVGGEWDALPHGGYLVTWYALWAQRYMHEFGIKKEDLSEIPVVARHYATLNPASVMGPKGGRSLLMM